MNRTAFRNGIPLLLLAMALCAFFPSTSRAVIDGITVTAGVPANLTAMDGHIRTGDGDSIYMWGYSADGVKMQYPGPTLIVTEGQAVTINLTNRLPLPVSLVFPGQSVTTATVAGTGLAGLLTTEVPPDKGVTTVSYTFTPTVPGTYTYYSGTRPELEVEMGLVGALIVRPATFNPATAAGRIAYNDPPVVLPAPNGTVPFSSFDREYLFVLSELDVNIHKQVESGQLYLVDNTDRHSVSWFMNGRNLPDTMANPTVAYLPNQPYNALPMAHPGERVLIRAIGAGRNLHPFHTHGTNHWNIAHDGRLLNSTLAVAGTPNQSVSDYTTTIAPGETSDELWGPWTGAKLGWDAYGDPTVTATAHTCNGLTTPSPGFDPISFEYCPDHGKAFPVQLPETSSVTFGVNIGAMYSGSPFLGQSGPLPPSNVNLNPMSAYTFMWHSHAERELTTNNVFIGGMSTMMQIVPCACDNITVPCTLTNCPFIDQYKP